MVLQKHHHGVDLVVYVEHEKTMFNSTVLDVPCEELTFNFIQFFCNLSILRSLKYLRASSKVIWTSKTMNKAIMLSFSRIEAFFNMVATKSNIVVA